MSSKIFATSISLVLGSWRLRLSLDLDDETFIEKPPHHVRVTNDKQLHDSRR